MTIRTKAAARDDPPSCTHNTKLKWKMITLAMLCIRQTEDFESTLLSYN